MLLPCHGHHRLIDETEETLLYGKRALICVEPSSLTKHGEGPAALDGEDSSAADSDITAAERRSLILSFYSHAAPLLPRMCRAACEVGAMEGKGGPGPRTSEVYMCSEVRVCVHRRKALRYALPGAFAPWSRYCVSLALRGSSPSLRRGVLWRGRSYRISRSWLWLARPPPFSR